MICGVNVVLISMTVSHLSTVLSWSSLGIFPLKDYWTMSYRRTQTKSNSLLWPPKLAMQASKLHWITYCNDQICRQQSVWFVTLAPMSLGHFSFFIISSQVSGLGFDGMLALMECWLWWNVGFDGTLALMEWWLWLQFTSVASYWHKSEAIFDYIKFSFLLHYQQILQLSLGNLPAHALLCMNSLLFTFLQHFKLIQNPAVITETKF